MKKNDLIKVIREIVRQEIKKELPNVLAQWFAQNLMGQAPQPNVVRPVPKSEPPVPQPEAPEDEMASLKSQLQEMFSGGAPVQRAAPPQQQQQPQQKRFTSNPVLNEILNQTRGFNSSERMANRVGGMGGGVALAAGAYAAPAAAATGAGQMMDGNELGFMRGVPGMPGADGPVLAELPTGHAQVHDGMEGGAAPLEALGAVSALDLKNHPALPDSIKGILTRDYRSLVRAMDKKK